MIHPVTGVVAHLLNVSPSARSLLWAATVYSVDRLKEVIAMPGLHVVTQPHFRKSRARLQLPCLVVLVLDCANVHGLLIQVQ